MAERGTITALLLPEPPRSTMEYNSTAKASADHDARSAQKRKREPEPDVIFVAERKRPRPSDEEVVFVTERLSREAFLEVGNELVKVSLWFSK